MTEKAVNRYLNDPHLDDVDHALGRPENPHGETYRNYYAANVGGPEFTFMEGSPWWERSSDIADGKMACFHVTKEGRQALSRALNLS